MNFSELFGNCLNQYHNNQSYQVGGNVGRSCLLLQDKDKILLFNINEKGWSLPLDTVKEVDIQNRFPVWASSTRCLSEMLGNTQALPYLEGDKDIDVDGTLVHLRKVKEHYLPQFKKSDSILDMKWVPKKDLSSLNVESFSRNILNKC